MNKNISRWMSQWIHERTGRYLNEWIAVDRDTDGQLMVTLLREHRKECLILSGRKQ